jgi:hypothetical protein
VHSNSKLWFTNNPEFFGELTSAASEYGGDTNACIFHKGFQMGVESQSLVNVTFSNLAITADLVVTGTTAITFSGTNMLITNATNHWTNFSYALTESRLVAVRSAGANNGDVSVGGQLDGRVTIVAERDINITNHLTYGVDPMTNTACDDALGLIAGRDIIVTTAAPNNLKIYAHMIATGNLTPSDDTDGSFRVQNYTTRPPSGDLTVWGGIVQNYRRGVGTFSGITLMSGYRWNYRYDSRLATNPPPEYPIWKVYPPGQIGGMIEDWSQWEEVASLPAERMFLAADVLNGALYTVGGAASNGFPRTNVYRYSEARWQEVAGLPAPRMNLAAGVLDGALYAIGGLFAGSSTNVYCYDGTNWTEVTGLPAGRSSLAAGALNGGLYAISGDGPSDPQTNVYRYNGTNWAEVKPLPVPRASLAAGVLNGALYALGGSYAGLETNVFRYDESNWTEVAGLPITRACAAGVLNGALYALGGYDKDSVVQSNVYRYPRTVVDPGVSPSSGSYTGGFQVVITGTNLCDGTLGDIISVTLCGATATVMSVAGSTQIVVTAGAGIPGPGVVAVSAIAYGMTVKTNGFTYNPALAATIGPHGTVMPSGVVNVVYGGGTSFVVSADTYYHIGSLLTNGVNVESATNQHIYTSVWMNVTATGVLTAAFAENLTTNTGTPEWWLATNGWTSDFVIAATNDTDEDGVPAWQEYLADTIPTDTLSVLRITNIAFDSSNILVGWIGGQQAWQYLERITNLLDTGTAWTVLWSNPPPNATATNFTDLTSTNAIQFYRIRSHR